MSILPPISPPTTPDSGEVDYPSSDGRPVAETPIHRKNLLVTIDVLEDWFAGDDQVYVSGNMFVYYVKGDKWKHVSPDVFVVRGVPKDKPRDYYLTWEEGRGPDLVIEVTSRSTSDEDVDWKLSLYRDTLQVREYFLFDPRGEYLDPALQGYRLRAGVYEPVLPIAGRLPSEVIVLHLEADGEELRLYDPANRAWLPTPKEDAAAAKKEAAAAKKDAAAAKASAAREQARAEQAEVEVARLRRELDALRREPSGG